MGNTNELTTKTKTVSMMSLQKDYIANIGKGLESILGSIVPPILVESFVISIDLTRLFWSTLSQPAKREITKALAKNLIFFILVPPLISLI